MHAFAEVDPSSALNVPFGQRVQLPAQSLLVHVPVGHRVKLVDPEGQKWPMPHILHSELDVAPILSLKVPTEQFVQVGAPLKLHFPPGQVVQTDIDVAPVKKLDVPASHNPEQLGVDNPVVIP